MCKGSRGPHGALYICMPSLILSLSMTVSPCQWISQRAMKWWRVMKGSGEWANERKKNVDAIDPTPHTVHACFGWV